MKIWSFQKVLDELETQTEYENPFAVTAEISTEETVLNYNIENGNISVTKSSGTFTTTFIDNEEFRVFLLYHSDWCFLGLDNFNSNHAVSALRYIWNKFIEHYRSGFERALSDMYYTYNPIHNYERSDIHYLNLSDSTLLTKSGTEKDTTTESGEIKHDIKHNGTETRKRADSNNSVNDTEMGKKANAMPTVDFETGVINTGTTYTGEMYTIQNYTNSYEDNTESTPTKKTNSQTQTYSTASTSGNASYAEESLSFNNRGTTDTTSYTDHKIETDKAFTNRQDRTLGNNKGQEGNYMFGNIGVTTSTAMVKEDVDFRMKVNIADILFSKFLEEFCFLGGDDDAD